MNTPRCAPRDAGQRRLTWPEICAHYPDQWVVLVDLEWIDEDGEFSTAVVLEHGASRDDTLQAADPIARGYEEFAHFHTGTVRALALGGLSP